MLHRQVTQYRIVEAERVSSSFNVSWLHSMFINT